MEELQDTASPPLCLRASGLLPSLRILRTLFQHATHDVAVPLSTDTTRRRCPFHACSTLACPFVSSGSKLAPTLCLHSDISVDTDRTLHTNRVLSLRHSSTLCISGGGCHVPSRSPSSHNDHGEQHRRHRSDIAIVALGWVQWV
jgi:hypothetical protein